MFWYELKIVQCNHHERIETEYSKMRIFNDWQISDDFRLIVDIVCHFVVTDYL